MASVDVTAEFRAMESAGTIVRGFSKGPVLDGITVFHFKFALSLRESDGIIVLNVTDVDTGAHNRSMVIDEKRQLLGPRFPLGTEEIAALIKAALPLLKDHSSMPKNAEATAVVAESDS